MPEPRAEISPPRLGRASLGGPPTRRVVLATGFTVVLLAAAVASWVAGLDALCPVVLASAPWALILWNRLGALAAFAITILVGFGGILFGMIVTGAFGIPLVTAFSLAALIVGTTGAWWSLRVAWSLPSPGGRILGMSGPAAGALLWIVLVVASKVLPGASAYGWVMSGDSANNLRFARIDMIAAGIQLGGDENPVPLPAGLLALGMSAGRGSTPSALLLRHDLGEFTVVWAGVIALLCIMVGVVASSAIPASRPRMRWLTGALASLLPMTWLLVGYPIEYGFFNAHIAILVGLGCWLVFRMSSARPAIAWTILSLAATLLLTVWSPLVLLPVSLMATIFLRGPSTLWRTPISARVLAIVGTAQLVLFGLAVTLPTLFAQGDALGMGGAAYPFSKVVLPAVALAVVVLALVARRRIGALQMQGLVATVVAFALADGVLAFAARASVDPLHSYYASKMTWVALVVILVVGLALALGVAASWQARASTIIAVAILAIGTVAFTQISPINKTQNPLTSPVIHLLTGDLYGPGDRVARAVLRYGDRSRPTILWRSGRPEEPEVDFWVLQLQASYGPSGFALRKAAYGGYDVTKPADLCQIVRMVAKPVRVLTTDRTLQGALASKCPELTIDVEPARALP